MGFYSGNYNITKLEKTGGEITKLELNGQEVPLAGAGLDNNIAKTIDVSTYTEPVEVTPTAGKEGMKKATITLSNVPEIESNKTATIDVSTYSAAVEITPTSPNTAMSKATVTLSNIPSVNAFSKDTPSFVTSLSTFEYVVLLLDSNGKFISDLTTETIDTIILARNYDFRVITKQTEANLSNKYEVILEDDVPSSLYADCEITYTNGVISYTNSDIQTTNTIELTSTTPTNISLLQCITSYRYS